MRRTPRCSRPTPRRRGEIDHWLDFQQTTLNGPHAVLFMGLVRTPAEQRDMAAIGAAAAAAGRIWAIIDAALAGKKFLAGDHLSLAEMAYGMHVHRWFEMPIDRPALPNLQAWHERLMAMPIYAKHIAIPLV